MISVIDNVEKETAKDKKKENPHVHRFSSYISDLKKNWAYVGTNRKPRFKCAVG